MVSFQVFVSISCNSTIVAVQTVCYGNWNICHAAEVLELFASFMDFNAYYFDYGVELYLFTGLIEGIFTTT